MAVEWDSERTGTRERTLVEGTWAFDISFRDCDFASLEFISEPTTVSASCGWDPQGNDIVRDVELGSFVLRTYSAGATFSQEKMGAAELGNGRKNAWPEVFLKDGTSIRLFRGYMPDSPIPLDEVDYVQLTDGTKLHPVTEQP